MAKKPETRLTATPTVDTSRGEPSLGPPPAYRSVSAKRTPEPPAELPPWVKDTNWEDDPKEAILRPTLHDDGTFEMQVLPPTFDNLIHPSEGDDVSQSNRHYRTLDPVDDVLRRQVELKRPGAGVFSDLMVYWDDPNLPRSSPDVFVVFDLRRPPAEVGESFRVAEEGTGPSLIFEVVSATYRDQLEKDYAFNRQHYAKASVRELVLVEPMTQGSPRIRRLVALRRGPSGDYQEIKAVDGRFFLETVGMTVHVEEEQVVLRDAETGERFLTSAEEEEARRAAEARTEAAEARAEDMQKTLLYERQMATDREAELLEREAKLRAEIERLKRSQIN